MDNAEAIDAMNEYIGQYTWFKEVVWQLVHQH